MTDRSALERRVGRRAVIAGLAGLAGVATLGAPSVPAASATVPQPTIRPRADWAQGLPSSTPVQEDVKFLLVHHSDSGNDYTPDSVPGQLRSFHALHTGKTKGWPDIAYNFLIDKYGTIWEGRSGSLAGPVRGSATGGSQGFAQLCCFIGDHTRQPPTAAAQASMSHLLAWLASRSGVDLHAGHTVTFTSRGSNRWPEGATVTTDPVAGHRDMSMTTCPGEACYPLVRGALLSGAQTLAAQAASTASTQTTSASSSSTPTTTASPAPAATGLGSPSVPTAGGSSSSPGVTRSPATATGDETAGDEGGVPPLAIGAGAAGVVLAVGAGAYARRSRRG